MANIPSHKTTTGNARHNDLWEWSPFFREHWQ